MVHVVLDSYPHAWMQMANAQSTFQSLSVVKLKSLEIPMFKLVDMTQVNLLPLATVMLTTTMLSPILLISFSNTTHTLMSNAQLDFTLSNISTRCSFTCLH